jgi:hypothetical protein
MMLPWSTMSENEKKAIVLHNLDILMQMQQLQLQIAELREEFRREHEAALAALREELEE